MATKNTAAKNEDILVDESKVDESKVEGITSEELAALAKVIGVPVEDMAKKVEALEKKLGMAIKDITTVLGALDIQGFDVSKMTEQEIEALVTGFTKEDIKALRKAKVFVVNTFWGALIGNDINMLMSGGWASVCGGLGLLLKLGAIGLGGYQGAKYGGLIGE